MLATSKRNWLELEQIGEVVVAKFTTTAILDQEKLDVIGQQMTSLGEEAGYRCILLNFGAVERLSTEMLAKVLGLNRKIKARGGQLVLCEIKPQLFEIFQTLKLPKVLKIYASEQEALQAL
jgi:stage II sporulation protein AA (anti-sigma F factor antagonist)